MSTNHQNHLQPLKNSDFQIVSGEPDVFGWEVKNERGTLIGIIDDLLFDTESSAVRYLIIDLAQGQMSMNDKKVIIPIGIAHLHVDSDEVVLPNLHTDQLNALPNYDADQPLNSETEHYIRSVIGSPAALRIEDTIVENDIEAFYNHHHFDRGKFYRRTETYLNN